jgi:hypothetical protein
MFGIHPFHLVHASCILMMIIVLELRYEVMNHCDLSYPFYPSFMYFYIFLISYIFSCSNGTSYIWQMVRTHTSYFTLDMPEGSGGRCGAAPTKPHRPAPGAAPPPPPPLPPVSIEQQLATQNKLMRVLTENLMHHGVR